MARPVVSETAEDLYASLEPLAAGDEETDWHLLKFCDALCETMLERIHLLADDRPDGQPGWQSVFDPYTAPAFALPYLAQFVGVSLEPGMTEADQRTAIALPVGWARGTVDAMRVTVQRFLGGSQSVFIDERVGGDAYALAVTVLADEQGDYPSEIERAILLQKPIGLVLTYTSTGGETWAELEGKFANWSGVESGNPTWFDVKWSPP